MALIRVRGKVKIKIKKARLTRLQLKLGVPCDPEIHWTGCAEKVRRAALVRALVAAGGEGAGEGDCMMKMDREPMCVKERGMSLKAVGYD